MKSLLLVVTTICTTELLAQTVEDPTELDYTIPKIEDMVRVPSSPEAAAYTKQGNLPISLYTGSPEVSIPITTLEGRDISIPISLSYDASGIKVNQIATWSGLGWNLNAGGVVTRIVNGYPDDYTEANPPYVAFYDPTIKEDFETFRDMTPVNMVPYDPGFIEDHLFFTQEQLKSKIETQPDYFSFSVNGLSGTVFIDYETGLGHCVEHPELLIDPVIFIPEPSNANKSRIILGWSITDGQGTRYEFNEIENTQSYDPSDNYRYYNSSWYLSSITTKNDRDIVVFNYSEPEIWSQQQYAGMGNLKRVRLDQNCAPYDEIPPGTREYRIEQFQLSSIEINGKTVASFAPSVEYRNDLFGRKALSKIHIHGLDGSRLNTYELLHSYFGTVEQHTDRRARLRLDGIDVYGNSEYGEIDKKFRFEYFDSQWVERGSFAQDHWGYFNGQTNNETFIPYNALFDADDVTFDGADRSPSLTHARIGTLKKITYPTGGTTEFDYKLHRKNGQVTTTYTETYAAANAVLVGGNDTNDTYGYSSCDDAFSAMPQGVDYGFWIQESGETQVTFTLSGENSGVNNAIQYAVIYKTGSGCYDTGTGQIICDTGSNSPFCDVYNDVTVPYEEHGVFTVGTSFTKPVNLTAGYYHMILLNSNPGTILNVSVIASRTISETSNGEDIGGLRVFKITDKTDDTSTALTKYIYYSDLSNLDPTTIDENFLASNNATTAQLHVSVYYENYYQFLQNGKSCTYLQRNSNTLATQANPHVTYSTVSEATYANGQINGVTVHTFYNENRAAMHVAAPKSVPLNGRELTRKVYKVDGSEFKPVLESINTFDQEVVIDSNNDPINMSGFSLYSNAEHMIYMLLTPDDSQAPLPKESFIYKPGYYGGYGLDLISQGRTNYQWCTDPEDNAPGNKCFGGPFGLHERKVYGLTSYWPQHLTAQSIQYADDGTTSSQTTEYEYNNANHFQVTSIKTYDSQGNERKKVIKYAHEQNNSELIADHRIAEPIRHEIYKNSDLMFTKETEFLNQNFKFYPSHIKTATGAEPLETQLEIRKYDDFGNPLEMAKENDIIITYLWGYDGTYPIAKIENALYDDVILALSNAGINAIETLDGQALRDGIDALRLAMPETMVTSYTYKPSVGMTSQTDPNGITTFYEYDENNRLKLIRDFENNILQAFEYKTKE